MSVSRYSSIGSRADYDIYYHCYNLFYNLLLLEVGIMENMRFHRRPVKEDDGSYECFYCDKSFDTEEEWLEHDCSDNEEE